MTFQVVCNECSSYEAPLKYKKDEAERVCEICYSQLLQRKSRKLNNYDNYDYQKVLRVVHLRHPWPHFALRPLSFRRICVWGQFRSIGLWGWGPQLACGMDRVVSRGLEMVPLLSTFKLSFKLSFLSRYLERLVRSLVYLTVFFAWPIFLESMGVETYLATLSQLPSLFFEGGLSSCFTTSSTCPISCSRSYLICLWLTYLVNSHSSLNNRKEASYTSITVELKWTCWGFTGCGRRRETTESGSSLLDRRNGGAELPDGTLSGFLTWWMPSINLSTWQSFVILNSLRISLICCSLRVRKTSVVGRIPVLLNSADTLFVLWVYQFDVEWESIPFSCSMKKKCQQLIS